MEQSSRPAGAANAPAEVMDSDLLRRAGCVLVVDDEIAMCQAVARALRIQKFDVAMAQDTASANEVLVSRPVDVVVCDEHMPGERGTEFFARLAVSHPDTVRILMTGAASLEVALSAINEGHVFRFFVKPCNFGELAHAVGQAMNHKRLLEAASQLLERVKFQQALIDRARKQDPSLFEVNRDASGAIVVDESPPDLNALLAETIDALDGEPPPNA